MIASETFKNQSYKFWADVRYISQEVGYTTRRNRKKGINSAIKVPSLEKVIELYNKHDIDITHIIKDGVLTVYGGMLFDYFKLRADTLNMIAPTNLMEPDEAETLYNELKNSPGLFIEAPNNKQTGDKAKPNYFTGIINTMVARKLNSVEFNSNPRSLTTVRENKELVYCLSRWVDGAIPDVINPSVIWEIKEYYYTTTFGSRVADGVYETQLDGYELKELETKLNRKIYHILFIDSRRTWWHIGKSYLCRLFDSMHMGHIDAVIIGRECITDIPKILDLYKIVERIPSGV